MKHQCRDVKVTSFTLINGQEVTVYEDMSEFASIVADLVLSNETVTFQADKVENGRLTIVLL